MATRLMNEAYEGVGSQISCDGPRGATRPPDERRGDHRGGRASEYANHVVAQRDSGVAHPRREELCDKNSHTGRLPTRSATRAKIKIERMPTALASMNPS